MDRDDIAIKILGIMLLLMLIGLFLLMIIGIPMMIWGSLEKECYEPRILKLTSVNGIEDIDTGLFSGGTVKEKTLLFDNGLIITKSSYYFDSLELRIGKTYQVKKCISNDDSLNYEIADKRRKAK